MKRQLREKLAYVMGMLFAVQACLPQGYSFAQPPEEAKIWQIRTASPSDAEEGNEAETDLVDEENLAKREDFADGDDRTDGDAFADEKELISEEDPVKTADLLATASNMMLFSAAPADTGDLWENWEGETDFSGDGTEEVPYKITCLAELMGLSERTAAGESFAGQYFELTNDIWLDDLDTGRGTWNPIGWYQDESELSGDVRHSFQGHFDGCGNTISGLKIIDLTKPLKNVGLFGVIDGGSVRNLTVEADSVSGQENAAVLVGALKGDAVIEQVTVSGHVRSMEDAGGIAGEVTGGPDRAVIENCTADGISLYSGGLDGYTGGIAGNVQRAYLVDCTALTLDSDADRIYGKGYIGGITGRMNLTDIYNSYVNGTVGGNGSVAVGGIVGKYESGNLVLARMAGDISRTNNGYLSREGTFIGTREGRHGYTYGTEKSSDVSYLYTNSGAKAKQVCGSTLDGDNVFTMEAHIGYWTDQEKKYMTVSGQREKPCGDRYFYEELEDGIRYIVTQKLENQFTSTGYFERTPFRIDHFAPGYMGEPVRGYLVTIPRIDARNANGTYDADVAALTALPEGNSSYYRVIDKDHPAAVASGTVVTVQTAPKNSADNRYQMIVSETMEGGVKPPTYVNEDGEPEQMQYMSGGAYSFLMPECDTELDVEYQKVTTHLAVSPEETELCVTQIRSGDRKAPGIVTEVRNREGILIARYIDGQPDKAVQVQPVKLHAESNAAGQTADRTVKWSVDDTDLLYNLSDASYTMKDGVFLVNPESSFIREILEREVKAQADGGYQEKIDNTVYARYAVVTASSNPDTTADGEAVYANCRVRVTFQIVDNTTVRVEGLQLNRAELAFTVTRKLTGNRNRPTDVITCSEPVVLSAKLSPAQPFLKNVSWRDEQGEKLLMLTPSGVNAGDCQVQVRYDASGKANPAWIQNIINSDNEKRKADIKEKLTGNAVCTEKITAVSEDQTHGRVTAECLVTIHFVTVDETDFRYYGSGGSSGGSGGSGGGGGRSSGGVTGAGAASAVGPGTLPAYVVRGSWEQDETGNWRFSDGTRRYADEWAAVYNPYADPAAGQSVFDWFRFDKEGNMMTGWFTDTDANVYYLNPLSDGTRGRMVTGWNWIDGEQFYFKEESDGTKGALCEKQKDDGSPER